jgi:hypothetical protein
MAMETEWMKEARHKLMGSLILMDAGVGRLGLLRQALRGVGIPDWPRPSPVGERQDRG